MPGTNVWPGPPVFGLTLDRFHLKKFEAFRDEIKANNQDRARDLTGLKNNAYVSICIGSR